MQSVIAKMKKTGITSENVERRDVVTYTTPLVKVDEAGNIHAYICLKEFDSISIAQLKDYGVILELVNRDLKIIQAWVPFGYVTINC
jgi:hypothetical protein